MNVNRVAKNVLVTKNTPYLLNNTVMDVVKIVDKILFLIVK